jgi:hypothetical protein
VHLGTCLFRIIVFTLAMTATLAATDVLSHHNDLASTGQNVTEFQITPANLTVATFQKRFATSLDSLVQAQPLYKAGVEIASGPNQGAHDMAFVATREGTLYGIDADSGAKLWEISLKAFGLPNQIYAETSSGLLSTPVIDPATNTMFVAYRNSQLLEGEMAGEWIHGVIMLYAVDIRDGSILRSTVVANTAWSVATGFVYQTNDDPAAAQDPFVFGACDGAIVVNGRSRVYVNAFYHIIRCGLTLLNGEVYITTASDNDAPPWHGWILRYNTTTLALTGVFNGTPNGDGGGIWQSGGALAVDPDGFIYCITGNGTFDGDVGPDGETIGLDPEGFPVNANYGDCYLKLGPDASSTQAAQNSNGWGLKVEDYFAPYNNQILGDSDGDLGSGGPVILPDAVGNATHPRLLVGCGKSGTIYLVDRDGMGKFDPHTDHVVQSLGSALSGCHSTPAYHNGRIYYVDAYYGGRAKSFDIADGAISPVRSASADYFGYPGSTPMISANGTANAIVWNIDRNTQQLRAYDAADFGNEIWTSAMAGTRDALGAPIATFAIPVVADGRVLVATTNSLVVYGPPAAATAAPVAPTDLAAATTSGAQITLTWNDNSNNEEIYRIEQSADGVAFNEIAVVGVNASSYVAGGLSSGSAYFFRVRAANAIGTSGYSNVATGLTASQPPVTNFSSGFQSSAGFLQFNGSAASVNARARLTSADPPQQGGSVWTVSPQNVADFSTQFTFQIGNPAMGEGFTFCIQNAGIESVATGSGTLGYQGIGNSIAVKFDFTSAESKTGLYLNGAQPTGGANEVNLSADGINFRTGNVFKVRLSYDGTTLTETITDTVTNATATASFAIDIPATVGGTSARVGFTGGTGGHSVPGLGFSRSIQDILSWSYFHLPTTAPSAPGGLAAAPASGTQVNLSWLDTSNNEDGFLIERKSGAAGTYQQVGEVGADAMGYIDGGLTPAATYSYRIRATNVVGQSAYSNNVSITTPTGPLPVENLRATEVTAFAVEIAWDPIANAESYGVLRASSTEANYARLASTAPDATLSLPPNATSYRDTTVQPGVTYSYLIQASNIAGVSVSEIIVTTPTRVSLSASGGPVRESSPGTATFTVSRLGSTYSSLTVGYQIDVGAVQATYGTRYTLTPAPSAVTIPAGESSATITLTPADDPEVEGPQAVTLELVPGAGYEVGTSAVATVGILDAAESGNAWSEADSNGNGVSNLMEFGFGMDPSSNASNAGPLQYAGTYAGNGSVIAAGLPVPRMESTATGVDFRALFVRRTDYATWGLTYTPQFSADMMTWTNSTAVPTVLADDGWVQIVSVPYPPFLSGEKAGLFRVLLSIP